MSRKLSKNQERVLRELANYNDRISTSNLSINGMRGIIVGKILSNLQHFGFASGTKLPKEHSYRWEITEAGRGWIADREAIKLQEHETEDVVDVVAEPETQSQPHPPTVSIPGSGIPPTTPDHFVFVVSEQKMADMMSARFGLEADEILLLKARVKTLEATIVENKKQMDILKRERDASVRERDTALELAEFLERKIGVINDALKSKI